MAGSGDQVSPRCGENAGTSLVARADQLLVSLESAENWEEPEIT